MDVLLANLHGHRPTKFALGIRTVGVVIATTSAVLFVIETITCTELVAMSITEPTDPPRVVKLTVRSRSGWNLL